MFGVLVFWKNYFMCCLSFAKVGLEDCGFRVLFYQDEELAFFLAISQGSFFSIFSNLFRTFQLGFFKMFNYCIIKTFFLLLEEGKSSLKGYVFGRYFRRIYIYFFGGFGFGFEGLEERSLVLVVVFVFVWFWERYQTFLNFILFIFNVGMFSFV